MGVMNLAQGDGINQVDVPRNQRGKRLLGAVPGIFPHQLHVIGHHLTNIWTLARKGYKEYSGRDVSKGGLSRNTGCNRLTASCAGKSASFKQTIPKELSRGRSARG